MAKHKLFTKVEMNTDLSKLSLAELKKLQGDIEVAMATRTKEKAGKARAQIIAIAQSVGMSVDELLKGGKIAKPVNKVAAQYQNPKNAAESWTGRGRQPRWLAEAVAGGAKLDDLKIKQAA